MPEINRLGCKQYLVPEDVCRIEFSYLHYPEVVKGHVLGKTIRDETVVVMVDEDGKIVSLELWGDKKPCMDECDSAEEISDVKLE